MAIGILLKSVLITALSCSLAINALGEMFDEEYELVKDYDK